jgi:hypothetical protein
MILQMDNFVSTERNLQHTIRVKNERKNNPLTNMDITPMITIPNVALSLSGDTEAKVCPPTIQFRIKNPCIEKTFRRLGMMAAGYLPRIMIEQTNQ